MKPYQVKNFPYQQLHEQHMYLDILKALTLVQDVLHTRYIDNDSFEVTLINDLRCLIVYTVKNHK